MTIRTRLALWYSVLLTITVLVLSLVVITVSRITVLNTIDTVLDQTAAQVREKISLVPVGEFGGLETEVIFKSEEIFKAPGVWVQVWQTYDGQQAIPPRLVRSSATLNSENPLDQGALAQNGVVRHVVMVDNLPLRIVTQPFVSVSGQIMGVIQVATSIESFQEANNTLLTIVVIASLVTILVSWLLSQSLAKRILKPIERVTQAAASIIDAKNLSTRIQWQGANDELGQLTQMFNHMMARLEQVFKVQQRFVGDVSHEMRTPLTSILGHLEIMNKYGVDQESLDAVHREAARMSRMVSDLLLLVRADNGELQIDLYPLEIDALVLEVYEQALILAKGRNLKIVLERIEEARIRGNTDRLKQLMLNLVSNAIKFTSEGGKVTLAIYPEGDLAMLEVRDTGIGIAEPDVKRIFDRFFQADNSRVHYSDTDGAGLGLSIVKWIVEAHSGTISVKSQLGVGTTFFVQFPLLPTPEKKTPAIALE